MRALIAFCVVLASTHYLNAQNPTIISDSLVVQQRLYAKEKLVVDQEARFKQDVIVKGDLKAKSDVRIDSTLRVESTAKFFSNVRMTGLGNINSIDSTTKIMVVLPNGELKIVGLKGVTQGVYDKGDPCKQYTTSNSFPVWSHGTNKIYAYYCDPVNVGIGTSTPMYTLDVRGISYSQKYLAGNNGGSVYAILNGFAQNSTENLMNLGVKLGVSPEEIRFTVSGYGEVKITNTGTQPSLLINNGKGHAIVVHANDGNKILQLEDDGLLRAREVRVDQDTWADNVFDDDYHLPKLGDVAQFIKLNHHLPGVPSAEQIDQEGLNLGEMQKIQMQKIEELTLYLIEMEKNMAKMETRITELEEENASLKNQK